MRTSILVGTHNEGDRLWKTVDSILESRTGLDSELIVADDASTDDSVEELRRRFPQVAIVGQAKRSGVSATRVLATSRARGEVLVFLDGHTRPEPGALERLVEDVQKTGGQAIITPQIVGLNERTWQPSPQQTGNGYGLDLETFDCWWSSLKKMKEVKEGGQSFFESPAFIGCAFAISRQLYEHLWGFDPHMRQWGGEDSDFALKAWTMGARILHDPEATIAHRFQRTFSAYEVEPEYPAANQIRTARKHFTPSVWEDWVARAQERQGKRLKGHSEGLWARAWEVFQENRKSAEHERAYLLSHRERDEFWYAKRFERSWPSMGTGTPVRLTQPDIPLLVLNEAIAFASGTPSSDPCYISSQTFASEPGNRSRTTIGVGEEITLTCSGDSATWVLSGESGGSLAGSGKSVTYTAGAVAGTDVITATATGCEADITFYVIAPTQANYQQEPDSTYVHTQYSSNLGYYFYIYLYPDTVNFYNCQYQEFSAVANATLGAYHCWDDTYITGSTWDFVQTVVSGLGTQCLGITPDFSYWGSCGGSPPFAAGSAEVCIPTAWATSYSAGYWNTLADVVASIAMGGDGVTMTLTKDGVTSSLSVNAATEP